MSSLNKNLLPQRVLLKVSGEALLGKKGYGIDFDVVNAIIEDIASVIRLGVEVCVVIGGGNIFRGLNAAGEGIDRVKGDYAGMLATVINAVVLNSVFQRYHIKSRVMSAIALPQVAETYVRDKALVYLNNKEVIIFAAGTGNPYFTTDTGAALRAVETHCDFMLKGTQVDGVYNSDPKKNPDAKRYDVLTYTEALSMGLNVMDATALSLARENNLPIIVFDVHQKGNFLKVVQGQGTFTKVVV
ncbi:Uridylate kinase [Commensalibacter sp. Nvir]|uniref:UMP kinase n=1 Tax=Commensalibacter sp. Nvir TaxID=3069817 RepID=UPI002D589845|nr:Uridylate kinase [Commensalibacter sp. Nvir]